MMVVNGEYVSCPKCGWEPNEGDIWVCDECRIKWNTFNTHGKCPGCGKVFIDTQCRARTGGCGQLSLNADWYKPIELSEPDKKQKMGWFWQRKEKLPITETEKKWVENGLITLSEVFGKEYFKSLPTITPDAKYFDRAFDGSQADAEFVLGRLMSMMQIDPSKIQLMFFTNPPSLHSGGLVTVNRHKSNSLVNTAGLYSNYVSGPQEIWVETSLFQNSIALTATLAHELTHYKLLGERRRLMKNDERLTDLAVIGLGFGIFRGNAWAYLSEPVSAYALAWLAHYRNEDISWKRYLNRTIKKYFEQSYQYISNNKDAIKWEA